MTATADAGIGEEHLDRAVVTLGLGDDMADVGLRGGSPAGHPHALGPLLGVAPRDRLADAARRAGDDADLIFDLHFILPIMLFRTASVPLASDHCHAHM